MSGFGAEATGASALVPQTLGLHDIAALQAIYGANTTTRSGDSTYGFDGNVGGVFDFASNLAPMLTIWDAGGTDTLDLSRYAADQHIRLAAGSHSSVGGFAMNLGIAYGSVIERATGGRGDDTITGNAARNLLQGGSGDDSLSGYSGADTLRGGAGGDTLIGGAGNDVLYGDDSVMGSAAPTVFDLVATDPATSASLAASGVDLFPGQTFTLELVWQLRGPQAESLMLRLGNLELHRHADGTGSLLFGGAEIDAWNPGILPPALTDGAAHRLSISYDDTDGRLILYLDGVRTLEKTFYTTTRNLDATGDIAIADDAALGDLRLFYEARSPEDIWANAWTDLPDPLNTNGLLHGWQGDGSGGLVNAFASLPDLVATGPVQTVQTTLESQSDGNRLVGGSGNDRYHVYSALDTVVESAGAGFDEIFAHSDFTLGAGQSVERLRVASGAGGVTLGGNAAANHLTSAADAADTLAGGGGNDSYHLYHSGDVVVETAAMGTDTIFAHANHVLAANARVEVLRAQGSQALSLTGNGFANRLYSSATHGDTLAGGAGNDSYYLYNAAARITENAGGGFDKAYAYANHVLAAGSQLEALYAMGAVGRVLTGNERANRFYSNAAAADTLRGGTGDDTYVLRHSADRVVEAAGGGNDLVRAQVNFTLTTGAHVETIIAEGSAGLVLTGNAFANRLVSAAAHADTLRGGGGNDSYEVNHKNDQVIETSASGGTDRIYATVNHSLVATSYVEEMHSVGTRGLRLTGNDRANSFFSSAAHADTLIGGGGNDSYTLRHLGDRVVEAAGGGLDVIYTHVNHALAAGSAVEELRAAGSAGLRLTGNELANRIFGGSGADSLTGGTGRDQLYGGEDGVGDRFIFRALADSALGSRRDLIHDFVSGQDRVDLRAIDANTTAPGDQAFAFSGNAGPVAFGVWLVAGPGQMVVRLDVTGDARADMEIGIEGLTTALRGDFLL